jgi:apolipoprotein N-acyltransferase
MTAIRRVWSFMVRRRVHVGLAALAGVLYFLGFCGFDQWALAWLCLIPILWALDDASLCGREAFALSWWFGTITHLGGFTWISYMLEKFAYLPLPLAYVGLLLLCMAQSLLLALWGWGVFRLRPILSPVWSAPLWMVVCEWLVPAIFPHYLANSQYQRLWFIQSTDLWGVLGLGFMMTLAQSSASGWLRGRRPVIASAIAILLLVGNLTYGALRIEGVDARVAAANRTVRIGMVQTNMGIYEKTSNPREGLERHRQQSIALQARGAEVIVWPESGYYYGIPTDAENVKESVQGAGLHTPLLFGAVRIERDGQGRRQGLYNSAVLADGDGAVLGTYDKTYLLAFGEYLPLGEWLPFLYQLSPNTSHFLRGRHTRPLVHDGVRYGTLICYEDILPAFTRQVMAHDPHILVNVTNDAWFGPSREPLIHLAMAGFRAVEHRRFLLRSTNTGISAVIDPVGRILHQTPVFARADVLAEVAALSGTTAYGALGNWPGPLCLALLAAALWRWRRARPGGARQGATR